ncbi:MAG TPA: chemotaxis protein CheB [Actinophytocola sp.]|jgi:two-component system chemotaxis response regulator CheB|nr:chemotaxis protein CheB [Actinophytocola sp.]
MGVRVLAVGASAGGVETLERLVTDLPPDLGACVLVTVHISSMARSALPRILARAGRLPAAHARDGELLQPNTIVVAPPDRHLLTLGGRVRLSAGPMVNRHRPSVDVMFTSALRWAGAGLVAVVLSGSLDDGAVGAALVAKAGGAVVVQDPAEAAFAGMPCAALSAVPAATVAPVAAMTGLLTSALGAAPVPVLRVASAEGGTPLPMFESSDPMYLAPEETGLTRLVCPDRGGSLAQAELPSISYYRCHVGHQWSPRTLAAAQAEEVEKKMWAAVAALDEQAALRGHLATRHGVGDAPDEDAAAEHLEAAESAGSIATALRGKLDALPHDDRGRHAAGGGTAG